jgi:hypothetical protein
MLRQVCATVVAIGCGLWLSRTAEAQVRQPAGYFVMQEVGGQNIKDVKLKSPVFTGIVIRDRWSNVAPTATTYNWAFLDAQVARARKYSKKYILSIYGGNNAPRWLNLPLYKTAPYPWDAKMLAAHGNMVGALGARYGKDPNLVGVEIGGPTRGPSGSNEMHLADGLTSQPGYSAQRMINAWTHCADQYARAFPGCALISDGGVAPGGRDATITMGLLNYMARAYPHQANFSHCALKANTSLTAVHHQLVVNMAQQGRRVGFEMVGPSVAGVNGEKGPVARFGGKFAQACVLAQMANAQWLKIYQGDELNAMSFGF